MSDLIVRAYDVRFGDAVLVLIPDTENGQPIQRSILFDFGNALGTEGGQDEVLEPVIEHIIATLAGRPLDLYVMTHEHLDHVQGLFYSAEVFHKTIRAKQAWLTGSADPDYYKSGAHPDAKAQKAAALRSFQVAKARLAATANASSFANLLLATNNPRRTKDCIDYLREHLTDAGGVHYVDRTTDVGQLWTGPGTITLLAPEEDTADYYGRFKPMVAGLGVDDSFDFDDLDGPTAVGEPPNPPSGVDAGAFYNLLDVRHGATSTLLSIDQASNNTSVVLLLEWQGWRLLFTGDAEKRSWRTMDAKVALAPVDFLKVSHHGSHTGMPNETILDKVLPRPAAGPPKRRALLSTFPKTYKGVPNDDTVKELRTRAELFSTRDEPLQPFVEIHFSDAGPT
jgi:beta-lactamase superfamily II metal-dependent hydrolase